MDRDLRITAMTKFLGGVLLTGVMLFLPAGTFAWWNGWLFMGLLFVPMLIAGLIMLKKNPALLRRRLRAEEKEQEQRIVVLLGGIVFIAAFILAGLNERFGWIRLPSFIVIAGAGFFLLGYGLYAEVLRENVWLSRTVEVQEDQQVIDTDLYGIVRHPMYLSTLILFLSMPLVLGSIISFVIMLLYIPLLAKRIRNEEQVLEMGLAGYKEYKERVRYRLIPFIW